jgi:hypothetical protein
VKGAVLMVNNVLYVTAPDHVGARCARRSRAVALRLKTKGGTHIGNRGRVVTTSSSSRRTTTSCRSTRAGKERWHEMASFAQHSDSAPTTIGNHIIVRLTTISTRRAISIRTIRKRATGSGASIPCR